MDLEPVYIRRSEAEVLWEKRHPEEAKATKPTEEM
jgi:tRNA threonylcarbamoyladenosine biosynthesis protein TsaB